MAGKTFTGIGVDDLLRQKPPLPRNVPPMPCPPIALGAEDDVHSVNSEPTIVDEDKVAEGLKRLRSLQTIARNALGAPECERGRGAPARW